MKKIYYIFFFFLTVEAALAQTQTVTQNVPFSTTGQSMWGTGGGFSLNLNQEIFRINPSVNWNSGNGGITSLGGYDFGMAMAVDFWMDIGSNFKIQGLTLGEVDVNYPINVDLVMPAANSFDKGDTVTINTGYTVDNAWDLTTRYPTGGRTSLDLHFGFGINVNLTLCAFGCTTIPIIPNLQLPVQTMDIFAIETQPTVSVTYPCPLFSPCGGGLPPCLPNICTSTFLPVNVPANGLGIGGEFNLPYVVTTDSYDPSTNCIDASGSHDYMTLSLDIFAFLDNFASRIPPPAGTAISAVLGNLSNSFSLPFGASLDYTIFAAQFNVVNSNTQDFSFCPKVLSYFDFPIPVNYTVTDPAAGNAQKGSGFGTRVNFNLGEDINFKYPCNYEFLNITPTYSIANADNFSNHTYDVISFNFAMQALSFQFTMPDIEIIPRICFPEICVELCWPDPSWSCPWCWDCDDFCTPAFCTPALVFPGFSIGFGPLLDETIPLGALPAINYFNDSWSLGGFTPQTMPSFQLAPRDYTAALVGTPIACKGDSTGTATVTITNGKPPYKYVWDNLVTTTTTATSQTLNGLESGTHYVIVTNANGCVTMDNVILPEPTDYLTIPRISVIDASCNAGSDGKITIAAHGGTGAYTYNWTPNISNSAIAGNLAAGVYNVIVTDANGCDTNTTATIEEPLALTSNVSFKSISCNSGADGSVDLSIAGGTTPYTYNWSNGASTEDLNGVVAGNYIVSVTDGKGCTTNTNAILVQPAAAVSIVLNSITTVLCKGGSNGAIDITASGGTPPYTYQWSNAANVILSSSTATINNVAADTYKVLVKDAKGCSQTATYTITEPAQSLTAENVSTNVSCFGGSNGSVNLTVTGGTTPYNYSWSNGITSQDLTGITQGNYSVTITDSNGCTAKQSMSIAEPNTGLSAMVAVTAVLCNGGTTGIIKLTVGGGTAPYSYAWSNGATTQHLSAVPAGNYSVVITDANGCLQSANAIITEPLAAIAITNIMTPVSCHGGNNGAIDITVTGGTIPYTYQWSNSDSVILSAVQPDLINLTAGAYTLLVTDANGCKKISSVYVTQPMDPIAINLSPTHVNCFAGNNGTVTTIVTGGTLAYTYNWNTGAGTANINTLTAGQYSLIITDANGCTSGATTTITQPASAVIASTSGKNVRCPGGKDGTIDMLASGGTPPYLYNWSNGAATEDLYNIPAGVYTVIVTDTKGCVANSGMTITEPANAVAITVTVDSTSCNKSADGEVAVSITGGTLPYKVQWGESIYLMSNVMNSQMIRGLIAGTYMVRIIDGNGCMVSQTATVYEPQPLKLTNSVTPVSCNGGADGTITISVTGGTLPYTYAWSDSTKAQNKTGLSAGYYDVKVTDANECKITSKKLEVQQPLAISVSMDITQISCKDEHDAVIKADAFGGVGGFTYSWSNGVNESHIEDLSANIYILTTIDANGCIRYDTVTIYPNTQNCIEIANTFTPNGDGKNDTWMIYNIWLYPTAMVKIFNEWGNLLYESTGYTSPWDGTYRGKALPSATYYYIIDLKNGEPVYNGPITIVR